MTNLKKYDLRLTKLFCKELMNVPLSELDKKAFLTFSAKTTKNSNVSSKVNKVHTLKFHQRANIA